MLLCTTSLAVADDTEIASLYFDELLSPTVSYGRMPRPVSQIADNVTVVTMADIERLQANTVDDVLRYYTGVNPYPNRIPGDLAMAMVQGFPTRQTLITYDGIPVNSLSDGSADVGFIPVSSLDRIEIIKGPTASVWGRSVGAVINLVSRDPDPERKIGGEFYYKAGEHDTTATHAAVSGFIEESATGYYLAGAFGETDGFHPHVDNDRDSLYTKLTQQLGMRNYLTLLYARTNTDRNFLRIVEQNVEGDNHADGQFAIARLTTKLSSSSEIESALYIFDLAVDTAFQNIQPIVPFVPISGVTVQKQGIREQSLGLQTAYKYNTSRGWFTVGFDGIVASLRNTDFLLGTRDARETMKPTLVGTYLSSGWQLLDDLTLTGAVRYDYSNRAKDVFSPSVGLVYELTDKTIIRTTAGEGYNLPTLANPAISAEPEELWRVQTGIESTEIPGLWTKFNAFYDRTRNINLNLRFLDLGPVVTRDLIRQGFEMEVTTAPVFHTSFSGGYTYLHIYDKDTGDTVHGLPRHNLILGAHITTNSTTFDAYGKYVDWNSPTDADALTWDFLLTRKVFNAGHFALSAQIALHNAFQGAQYSSPILPNQPRWLEGGIKVVF